MFPRLRVGLTLVTALGAGCTHRPTLGGASGTNPPEQAQCTRTGLSFRPQSGARYRLTVEEGAREPYRSTIIFTPTQTGWSAIERGFAGPFLPAQVGDLSEAELRWQLDLAGVPVAPPEESGGGRPGIVPNLSLFAFRPVGLVLGSTCAGVESSARWTDSAARVRSVHYRVTESAAGRVVLRIFGSVETAVNRWKIEGTLEVASADGLTGEARLHERGPGAPAVNDRERIVRVARE